MKILSSKSATVLVIFVIAVIAFCLASVFGAMVGPISILPNNTDDTGSILDNLSAITEGTGDTGDSYGYQDYNDYSQSSSSYSSDSGSDDSNIETTSEPSQQSYNSEDSESDDGGSPQGSLTPASSDDNIEKTVDTSEE